MVTNNTPSDEGRGGDKDQTIPEVPRERLERLRLPEHLKVRLEEAEWLLWRVAESDSRLDGIQEPAKEVILMAARAFTELLWRAACDREDTKGPLCVLHELGIKVVLVDPWTDTEVELPE